MPTDDDYGRRERLLLHQHPISQYGPSPSPISGSTVSSSGNVGTQIGSGNPPDCFKEQQQQQQQQSDPRSTGNTSNPSSQDRYQTEQQSQSNEHVDYGGARERMPVINRHDKSTEKSSTEEFPKSASDSRAQQSGCERFGHYQAQERFPQHLHHQYTSSGRSAAGQNLSQSVLADRFARFNELSALHGEQRLSLSTGDRFQQVTNTEHRFHHAGNNESSGDRFQQVTNTEHRFHHGGNNESAGDRFQQVTSTELRFHHAGNNETPGDRFQQVASTELRFHHAGSNETSGDYANGNVTGCTTSPFSSETFPSPPSPAPANDRFVPPPPLSPTPSEKYSSSQSLAGYPPSDRLLPPGSPGARYGGGTAPASPMPAKFSSAERLLAGQQQASGLHESKDHQQRYPGITGDRLLSGSSPVLGSLQSGVQSGDRGYAKEPSRYGPIAADRLLSSSPIHAPVPERFAGKERYLEDSPIREQYHRQQETPSSVHHDRYVSPNAGERFLSSVSPNPEESHHQRYATAERSLQAASSGGDTRRVYADRSVETVCQKYSERSSSSPAPTETYSRYAGFQEGAQTRYGNERFAEIQRCGRSNERFSGERYLAGSSPGHDGRLTETPRYVVSGSSTERLLAATSSSPSSSEAGAPRYHYTTSAAQSSSSSSSCSGDRFTSVSPTPEASSCGLRPGYQGTKNDKYHFTGTAQSSSSPSSCPGERFTSVSPTPEASSCGLRSGYQGTKNDKYHLSTAQSSSSSPSCSGDRFISVSPTPEVSSCGLRPGYQGTKNDKYHFTTAQSSSSSPSCSADRFTSVSPTPEASTSGLRSGYQATKTDKYLQVSKPSQGYAERYSAEHQLERISSERYDRFSASSNTPDRFASGNSSDRFHAPTDRYSPARSQDKYLSLPKDRFVGRITGSTATERGYAPGYVPPAAHTPVERYVPQPPPEVLYPERYVDRYVPPAAHTPTDRYVPANDPGDPYMRRDLGFHHHYRLPPPAGYPYHQPHFRFRGFAYASPGRLGGSPGSSSSGSSASNQRDGFSTSPLLRPKVRASTVEFTSGNVGRHACGNAQACCPEAGRTTACCQPIRRSLPPGALPSIPSQPAHSSW
ncbi:hypothetical protein KM043_011382 [Ampulex compressa]|nr:hypothetical protein KM043_011382 [Ampulex compressa]